MNKHKSIVIAIDGTSASGKSTNARLVAKALGFAYVDTGAMYRTLAWYCRKRRLNVRNEKIIGQACRRWKTKLICAGGFVHLLVNNYFPEKEIRTAETSALVPKIAAAPQAREWMKRKQRECLQFGSLVMEGRDIGSNVFPETNYKFYLDATLGERSKRREADGVQENLEARDRQDSQRAKSPLMIPIGATLIDTSSLTPTESSKTILAAVRAQMRKEGMLPSQNLRIQEIENKS